MGGLGMRLRISRQWLGKRFLGDGPHPFFLADIHKRSPQMSNATEKKQYVEPTLQKREQLVEVTEGVEPVVAS